MYYYVFHPHTKYYTQTKALILKSPIKHATAHLYKIILNTCISNDKDLMMVTTGRNM